MMCQRETDIVQGNTERPVQKFEFVWSLVAMWILCLGDVKV
jgi:hypothetical protein